MSEYQYYEFRAIDRPLTAKKMSVWRRARRWSSWWPYTVNKAPINPSMIK